LRLRNFRLFEELTFQPDTEAITVLLSPNGTGKTTVLEAVYTLATATSFRTGAASDLIRTGESASEVHGVLYQRERRVQVDLTLTRGTRNTTKRMLVNGQRPSRAPTSPTCCPSQYSRRRVSTLSDKAREPTGVLDEPPHRR